jgi:glycosyltransferase involved in cell wall biosynthesis
MAKCEHPAQSAERRGLVSVIVAAYNHEAYIRQCIDSALAQTYPDVEIVVVDDGSSDGTYEILKSYDDSITLIRSTNRGTQAARNAAIAASTGQYLALLDSDDYWLPHKLAQQMQVFVEHPDTALVYSLALAVDEVGSPLGGGVPFGRDAPDPHRVFETLLASCHIPALTAVFKRACLDAVGSFDESLLGSGDWDMWLKIAERWSVRCVPEPLAFYRVHPTNTTKMLFASKRVVAEHGRVLARYLSEPGRRRVDHVVVDRAYANLALREAECAVLDGDGRLSGRLLARALTRDPSLGADHQRFQNQILSWAMSCKARRSWPEPVRFARQVFNGLADEGVHIAGARRAVLAAISLDEAFARYHRGDKLGMICPLTSSIMWAPSHLGNAGVWSMLGFIVLGRRAMSRLRPLARRLLCHA